MARKAQDVTDAELAILEQLWASGPTSVKVLATELYGDSGASTTATVQKLLERLERKNCVARDRSVWPRLFRTAIDRAELIEQRWFFFGGIRWSGSLVGKSNRTKNAAAIRPRRWIGRISDASTRKRFFARSIFCASLWNATAVNCEPGQWRVD